MAYLDISTLPCIRKSVFAIAVSASALSGAHASDLDAQFKSVCDAPFVKSDKLDDACATGERPRIIADGSRFDARGLGGEVNVLAANLHLVAHAE